MKKAPISKLDPDLAGFRNLTDFAAALEATETTLGQEAIERAPTPESVEIKVVVAERSRENVSGWLTAGGAQVTSSGGQVITAAMPRQMLEDLEQVDGVIAAEAPRLLHRNVDAAATETNLPDALAAHGRTGQGVYVAVVDSGVDWSHADFIDDGNTRFAAFHHLDAPLEFGRAEVQAALDGTQAIAQGDPDGHGTHCASIAAGNGAASDGTFRGVAPGAELLGMRCDRLSDTNIIRAIRAAFAQADADERPVVVNLSLGGHIGAHDGTSAIENVIRRESGPGKIVVVAAGNQAEHAIHWSGQLREGETTEVTARLRDTEQQTLDLWISREDDVDVVIQAPDGSQFEPDGSIHSTVFGVFQARFQQNPLNGDFNLRLTIVQGLDGHLWRIRLKPDVVVNGQAHAWAMGPNGHTGVFLDADPRFTVGMPGTAGRAITVGSFVSKRTFATKSATLTADGLTVGQRSPFSSIGPDRYGRHKPDIAAPGQFITAALSSNSKMATDERYTPRHHPTDGYITIQGTSMAAPYVTGLIALLLENEPDLNPEEIQRRLVASAVRNEQTGGAWNAEFGYGRVDAAAFLAQM
ncbi:MAG: S8 family serine peptidase [Pseudomonadota bacterium]